MVKIRIVSVLLSLAIILSISPALYSQSIPQLINYNGTLTDVNGNPVPDGQYDVAFNIYDAPTGGNVLWTETWNPGTTQVVVTNGNFNAVLGAHNALPSSFFTDNIVAYLGITIGTDSEMMPRQRITSVGYAFTAGNGIPQGGIIMWSGAIANIPSGWALCNGTNGTPDLRDRFVVGAGSGYAVGDNGGSEANNISHTHGISTASNDTSANGSHNHSFSGNTAVSGSTKQVENGGTAYDGVTNYHTHSYSGNTSSEINHVHQITHSHGGATVAAGSTALENRPPYYALAFIMKL